LKLKVNLLMIL